MGPLSTIFANVVDNSSGTIDIVENKEESGVFSLVADSKVKSIQLVFYNNYDVNKFFYGSTKLHNYYNLAQAVVTQNLYHGGVLDKIEDPAMIMIKCLINENGDKFVDTYTFLCETDMNCKQSLELELKCFSTQLDGMELITLKNELEQHNINITNAMNLTNTKDIENKVSSIKGILNNDFDKYYDAQKYIDFGKINVSTTPVNSKTMHQLLNIPMEMEITILFDKSSDKNDSDTPIQIKIPSVNYILINDIETMHYFGTKYCSTMQYYFVETIYLLLFIMNIFEYVFIFLTLNKHSKPNDNWFNYQCLNLLLWRNGNVQDLFTAIIVSITDRHQIKRSKWSKIKRVSFNFRFFYLLLLLPSLVTHSVSWIFIMGLAYAIICGIPFLILGGVPSLPAMISFVVCLFIDINNFKTWYQKQILSIKLLTIIVIGVGLCIVIPSLVFLFVVLLLFIIVCLKWVFPHDRTIYQISLWYNGDASWTKLLRLFWQFRSISKYWNDLVQTTMNNFIHLKSLQSVSDGLQFLHRWL